MLLRPQTSGVRDMFAQHVARALDHPDQARNAQAASASCHSGGTQDPADMPGVPTGGVEEPSQVNEASQLMPAAATRAEEHAAQVRLFCRAVAVGEL